MSFSTYPQHGIVCGKRALSRGEFLDLCGRAATGFQSLGADRGDAIAILMRNDIDFIVAQSAAAMIGCHAVPLNWHSAPADLAYILRDSGAKLLVAHSDLLGAAREHLPRHIAIVSVATPPEVCAAYRVPAEAAGVALGDTDWATWLPAHAPLTPDAFLPGGGLGIYYTSGTTGRPKGVQREPLDATASAKLQRVVEQLFGARTSDHVRVLVSAPIYHGAPNFFANRGAVPGSLCVLQPRFDAEDVLRLIERHRITHAYMVPTTMKKLIELPAETRSRYDLSSLQRLIHSAAPCPPDLKRRMIEWLGPVVYEFYGGTECGTITMISSEEFLAKPGSVGRRLDDCEILVCDEEGNALPAGAIGEIFARNFNTPRFAYRHLEDRQHEVERGELVSIGDVGYLDEDGFLFLCDRKRDVVISAGVNIYPAEIEAVLLQMPEVADCVVFGVPDATYGEALCCHIEPKGEAPIGHQEVETFLRGRLATYQIPRHVVLDRKLPREESGKIMKRKVRDSYWQDMDRLI